MLTVGERIRELRLAHRMSQEDLGIKLGIGRAAVQKYEKGTVDNIPIKKVEEMARVLHSTPSYILGWEDSNYLTKDVFDLCVNYMKLTDIGKDKAQDYLTDLGQLYKK